MNESDIAWYAIDWHVYPLMSFVKPIYGVTDIWKEEPAAADLHLRMRIQGLKSVVFQET